MLFIPSKRPEPVLLHNLLPSPVHDLVSVADQRRVQARRLSDFLQGGVVEHQVRRHITARRRDGPRVRSLPVERHAVHLLRDLLSDQPDEIGAVVGPLEFEAELLDQLKATDGGRAAVVDFFHALLVVALAVDDEFVVEWGPCQRGQGFGGRGQSCATDDSAPVFVDEFVPYGVDDCVDNLDTPLTDVGQTSDVCKAPWLIENMRGDVNRGRGNGIHGTVFEPGQAVGAIGDVQGQESGVETEAKLMSQAKSESKGVVMRLTTPGQTREIVVITFTLAALFMSGTFVSSLLYDLVLHVGTWLLWKEGPTT